MADTSVKLFHSALPGAPVQTAAAGSIVTLLDACLVNGFGLTGVTSLSIASSIATVITTTPHSLQTDLVGLLAGITGPAASLNGQHRVTALSAYSFTFPAPGVSDQTATGTITSKNAPLGWSATFTGTNLRTYRSNDSLGSQFTLRVDDTNGNDAYVRGYESMTDIDTGVSGFPLLSQSINASGNAWPHHNGPWVLVGDTRGFYLATNSGAGYGYALNYFGDVQPDRSGDAFAVFCSGFTADPFGIASASTNDLGTCTSQLQTDSYGYMARAANGLGGSVKANLYGFPMVQTSYGVQFSGTGPFSYPDATTNELRLIFQKIVTAGSYRGTFPGYYLSNQGTGGAFAHMDKVDGQGDLLNHRLVSIQTGSYSGTTSGPGNYFIDFTGPWAR